MNKANTIKSLIYSLFLSLLANSMFSFIKEDWPWYIRVLITLACFVVVVAFMLMISNDKRKSNEKFLHAKGIEFVYDGDFHIVNDEYSFDPNYLPLFKNDKTFKELMKQYGYSKFLVGIKV